MKVLDESTKTESHVYEDLAGTIGNTPLVRLNQVTQDLECEVYAKLEMFNPGGSVKDRIAFPMLEAYERDGTLKPGGTVVEATSGNTGVGLALACAMKGYRAIFVMPDKMSEDKVRLLRAYGARVVITPTSVPPEDPRSYYSIARQIVADTPNAILANQYHNLQNPESHYLTTGPEIWEQTAGRVTDIVVGMGTGGTISGIGRFMRENDHPVRMIGVDPVGSLLFDAWQRGGIADGLQAHTYKVEGIGEDFIPSTLDLGLVDQVVQVDDFESFQWARRLVREEGIFCGGSSGSALAGAVKAACDYGPERLVVVVFPDSGSRYLTKLYDDGWMREHGFLPIKQRRPSVLEVASTKGSRALITASYQDLQSDVIATMREHGISQLPVIGRDGELLGIVSEVSLLNHLLYGDHDHTTDETIEGLVTENVATVSAEDAFEEVLPELLEKKAILLVDKERCPVDILTLIDGLEYAVSRDDDNG
jgi:cystathionine beta-synthase